MKILKPGKVELRRFTCHKCGCEFVAAAGERCGAHAKCPQGCGELILWKYGEHYEEPVRDAQTFKEA